MKFKKWLKQLDTSGLKCNIYMIEDKEDFPIFCGSMMDIPYWLTEYEIAEEIFYATGLRKTVNDKMGSDDCNGFVITLKNKEQV